jgi:integrase
MNIYKQSYIDKDGKKAKTSKFYIEFLDHNKIRHKLPAFADKRVSEAFGRNIESLINCRLSGLEHDVKLNQWLETLPPDILKKFTSWGLIDGQRAEITKPLAEHIKDYGRILEVKGYSTDYVRRMKNRLKKIIEDCRFTYFRDITKSSAELYIGKLRNEGKNDTTIGHYIDCLKTFLNWAEIDGRILRNPIAQIEKPARDSKKKGILTPEQFISLIKKTFENNTLIGNISGQDRAMLYVLAGTTGLRRNELLNLTWNDINLSDDNAFVRVRACIAKNGKEAFQPLPPIAVNLLTALNAHIKPQDTDRVFAAFDMAINTAELIQTDLKTAEIDLIDKDGNEICFHSLRNSYISWLANSQTPAKVVQKLARHSDPRLTFNTYARVLEESEQKAISFLPDFGNILDENRLCASLCKDGRNGDTSIHKLTHKNSEICLKRPFGVVITIPSRGVEPLLQA